MHISIFLVINWSLVKQTFTRGKGIKVSWYILSESFKSRPTYIYRIVLNLYKEIYLYTRSCLNLELFLSMGITF